MADLNVTIGTDATAFNRGMASAAQTAQTTATRINRSAQQIGAGVQAGANQAQNALTNLGRVAQDAPFGFVGIQNNLNPLLESFQRLRTEAGSNVGALKALIGSLTGAAGLGLALSLVGSAITLYTQYQQKASKATKEAKDANEGYLKTAVDDVANLTTLYSATQNVTLSLGERKAAVDELQKQYPAYFKNLSDEAILAGKAKSAYDSLSNSIINKAIIDAGQDNIKVALKPLIDSIIEQRKLQAELDKSNAEAQKRNPAKTTSFDLTDQNGKKIPGMRDVVTSGATNRVLESFVDDETAAAEKLGITGVQSIQKYQERLKSTIVKAKDDVQALLNEFGVNSFIDPDKNFKDAPKAKTLLEQLEAQLKSLQDAEAQYVSSGGKQDFFHLTDRERDINALINKIAKLKEATNGLDTPTVKGTNAVTVSNPSTGATGTDSATIKGMQDYVKHTKEIANQIGANEYNNKVLTKQEQIGRKLISTFGGGLTDAFQNALNGTQSFVSAMGQFLLQLITKLVAAALAAVALAVILSAVGFGPGIGGAASQIGSFKNIFGSLSGIALADGGITQGPTRALIGEGREQEAVIPLSKLGQFVNSNGGGMVDGKIVGVMRGSDLLLQYRRAEKSNQRRG